MQLGDSDIITRFNTINTESREAEFIIVSECHSFFHYILVHLLRHVLSSYSVPSYMVLPGILSCV